jgi:hypothetical protein
MKRGEIYARVKAGELTQVAAAELLGLSYRQVKRQYVRYRSAGAKGLVHGNVGRSNRARPAGFRKKALAIVGREYGATEAGAGFGPTLAAEHLAADHGLSIAPETLRRWMIGAGLWSRQRRRKAYRQRRERRAHFGEMLQIDGSFHDWLEGRGRRLCLISLVDDATGKTGSLFEEEETTWGVLDCLRRWVEQHGIPRALYTDRKTVYVGESRDSEEEESLSQLRRVCLKLGIEMIQAHSPQAKGRVERNHGTHQDRLVKKMRRRKISDRAAANRFLDEYLPDHNQRYARVPVSAIDFHHPVGAHTNLDAVFCLENERSVSSDWVVRFQNRYWQIEAASSHLVQPGDTLVIQTWRDQSHHLVHRGKSIESHEIPAPLPRPAASRPAPGSPARKTRIRAQNHPWNQSLFPSKAPLSRLLGGESGPPPPLPAPLSPARSKGTFLTRRT